MLAALAVAATLASGCGPDYITQLPVLCEAVLAPPADVVFPVAPDGSVSIAARWPEGWRPLRRTYGGYCREVQRRRDLVATIYRCGEQLRVVLHRRDALAPRRVKLTVAGGIPA